MNIKKSWLFSEIKVKIESNWRKSFSFLLFGIEAGYYYTPSVFMVLITFLNFHFRIMFYHPHLKYHFGIGRDLS